MSKFKELFKKEFHECIEALTGIKSSITEIEQDIDSSFVSNIVKVDIKVTKDREYTFSFGMVSGGVIDLSQTMMGEDVNDRKNNNITDEDLDVFREITSNIFGSIKTTLSVQDDAEIKDFHVMKPKFIKKAKIDTKEDSFFRFCMLGKNSDVVIFNSGILEYNIKNNEQSPKDSISSDNISLDDIEVPLKVRIAKKELLLQDVYNLDVGSIVEFDKNPNEEVELFAGDVLIGTAEVVVVDGNYGVQIVSLVGKTDE